MSPATNPPAHHKPTGKVSVIMAVYNVATWLPEALQSVQRQTYRDWECICVDDGSTDCSPEILREYARQDSRFRIITQPNQGPGAARNKGIAEANGDYLLIMDSDDLIEPELFETCLRFMQADDSDLCVYGYSKFWNDDPGEKDAPCFFQMPVEEEGGHACYSPAELGNKLFFTVTAYSWNRMYRTSWVRRRKLGYTSQRHWEDLTISLISLAVARRISYVRESLYLYRMGRDGSLTTNLDVKPETCRLFPEAYRLLWQDLKARGLLPQFGVAFLLRFLEAAAKNYFQRPLTIPLARWGYRTLDALYSTFRQELAEAGVAVNAGDAADLKKARHYFRSIARRKPLIILLRSIGLAGVLRGVKSLLQRQ